MVKMPSRKVCYHFSCSAHCITRGIQGAAVEKMTDLAANVWPRAFVAASLLQRGGGFEEKERARSLKTADPLIVWLPKSDCTWYWEENLSLK